MTFASQKREVSPVLKTAYYYYFDCKIKDQNKFRSPNICSNSCAENQNNMLV